MQPDHAVSYPPDGPCGLCGGVLAWVEDWPNSGEARWACLTCAAWPVATPAAGFGFVTDAMLCASEPCAWRLHSQRRDRELRLARDAQAASALDIEGARDGLPVVLADDLEQLRMFDDQLLHDLLDVLAIVPGARLAHLEPEMPS